MRRIIGLLLLVGILGMCSGCLKKSPSVRVVEQINVQWMEDGHCMCRVHQTPEKMHLILNKLRTLGQRFSTDVDPDSLETPAVTMTCVYSDGSQRIYQLKPDRFIRTGEAPWQQADPKKVTALRLLLLSLPGDFQT